VQKSPRSGHFPRARPDLTFRPVGGDFALTDRAGAQTERLSLVAAIVWTYCDGRHAPEAIAEAVARELPEAADDVETLLARFARQGIVS
jgi:Coenzyme PQQ synthesis protein D (PqqD)